MNLPKQALNPYELNKDTDLSGSEVTYWLCNYNGDSYYLRWWGNGWVVQFQESFLCKNNEFKFKGDIPSFEYSIYGKNWQHVFDSKEEAIEAFKNKFRLEK